MLQSRRYCRVGDPQELPLRARFLAASNRDLRREVAAGRFREDLYYRIRGHVVTLPALRDRPEDILPLFRHFVRRASAEHGCPVPQVEPAVELALAHHPFPGNVRELEQMAGAAVVLAGGGMLRLEHLPRELVESVAQPAAMAGGFSRILAALQACNGNRTRAAARLGCSREHVSRMIRKHGGLEGGGNGAGAGRPTGEPAGVSTGTAGAGDVPPSRAGPPQRE